MSVCPNLTGNARTDRTLVKLARLLYEITGNPPPTPPRHQIGPVDPQPDNGAAIALDRTGAHPIDDARAQ